MTFNEAHRLIKKSDLISLRNELSVGLNPNLANEFSWNLLMLAAIEGDTSVGELLISNGANVDATNDFGETPLSLAAHGGHIPFIKLLLANGASKECRPHGHGLRDWLQTASSLSHAKIDAILELVR